MLEKPTQLITFTCPFCKELNLIKVERVVDFSQVGSRTIVCAGCSNSLQKILPGPVCDGPNLKKTHTGKWPRRQVSGKQWTLIAGKESLTGEPALAVLMLRLGASINALRTAQRMILLARRTPGLLGLRDLCWTYLVATAQLKECIDRIIRENLTAIKAIAAKGGASREEIAQVEGVIDVGPDSLYSRVLQATGNQQSHWAEEPFETWRVSQGADAIVWVLSEGERDADEIHLAAATALTQAILPNPSYEELNQRAIEVSYACGIVVRFFHQATAGYLENYGAENSSYPDVGAYD